MKKREDEDHVIGARDLWTDYILNWNGFITGLKQKPATIWRCTQHIT